MALLTANSTLTPGIRALQGALVSAEFCSKQIHEIGPRSSHAWVSVSWTKDGVSFMHCVYDLPTGGWGGVQNHPLCVSTLE